MEIIFDIIIVAILLMSIYLGYKKGLVNVGFNLFAIIVSLLVTVVLYSPITHLVINNTQIDESIEKIIIENGTAEAVQNSNENNGLSVYVQSYAQKIAQEAQNTAVENVAKGIAVNVVGIGVMLALFIATRIVLILLKTFTNIITKIPIIKQCNELAGIAYGVLRGLIIVYGILAIIFFAESISGNALISMAIEQSYVTKIFYDNNIILKLLF